MQKGNIIQRLGVCEEVWCTRAHVCMHLYTATIHTHMHIYTTTIHICTSLLDTTPWQALVMMTNQLVGGI